MLRRLMLIVIIAGSALLTAPFLLTSLATDENGVTIPGRVSSKSETIGVRYSAWKRTTELSVQYEPLDGTGTQFFTVTATPELYDSLHVGDRVALHYLQRRDVPDVPGIDFLWQLHALPVVRLAQHRTFTRIEAAFTERVVSVLTTIAGIAMMLLVLRLTRSPLFKWALGVSIASGIGLMLFYDFPRPTPAPRIAVRRASGRVKSIHDITKLLNGSKSRGFIASQPVDVVGVEFVPEGRRDAVVAVDLIDTGSVPGLVEGSTVGVQYEANQPRVAYIERARRDFAARNLTGIAEECILSLGVLAALYFGAQWIGKAFTRMVAKRNQRRSSV